MASHMGAGGAAHPHQPPAPAPTLSTRPLPGSAGHRTFSEEEHQPPRAEPEDIFYQIDQEIKFIQEELSAAFAKTRQDFDAASKGQQQQQCTSTFPQRHIEALFHLKQFSPIFRNAYKDLLSRLPISISLRSRYAELGVPMTSPVDMPSTHYARFRCVYADTTANNNSSPQCETWTFKPYVIDTYLIGLSRVLGAAADTMLEGNELEAQLAAGYRQMCCSGHEDKLKEEQASVFAVASRPVVMKWRDDVQLWWSGGKRSCMAAKAKGEKA
ncbi:hypothetical protein CBER1_07723 [Cercospora berteroae]|uniref:Uncharacterized protein n=1 Tax=Cercospora berteroae TaxID=357750 RepID=A0A2S6BSN4_9PEZI|nr:hypothetical protein CBER1_07723 [Cercospora berteroae]